MPPLFDASRTDPNCPTDRSPPQILGDIEGQWPGVSRLPDWGKVSFPKCEGQSLSDLLPGISPGALDLLQQLLRCD